MMGSGKGMSLVAQIIISILVWGMIGIALLRTLGYGGLKITSNNKLVNWLYEDKSISQNEDVSFKEGSMIVLKAFIFRIIIYIISILIMILFIDNFKLSLNEFLSQWQKWDAHHYINIAKGGYKYYVENGDYVTLAFFPLYPSMMRILYSICRDYRLAALLVSSICYSIMCYYVYALVALDYGKAVAKKVVIYISIFPFAFFYGGMMTESIFMLMTVATFYYIRKHEWLKVGLFGALCAFSRMIGVIMILPAAFEWCETYKPFKLLKNKNWKELRKCFSYVPLVLITLVGTLGYLYINYKNTGGWFTFLEYQQKYWNHENCYFTKTLIDIFKYVFNPNTGPALKGAIWIPEAIIFTATIAALIYGVRKHKGMYTVYLAAYMVINCSVTWLISGGRYMSAALPLFIILGDFTERHKEADKWIKVIFLVLFGIYFTGYLLNKQIM